MIPLATNIYRKTSRRYWSTALYHTLHRPKLAWGRMRKGYNYADVWSFDTYLAQVIAGGLRELAKSPNATPIVGSAYYSGVADWTKSIPVEVQEGVSTDWRNDLLGAADKLDLYVEDNWKYHEEAREAMMWVAENFGSLWD